MKDETLANLLSASSLLLAVVGVLYGLWYAEISTALTTTVHQHRENNEKGFSDVSSVLFSRAVPLTVLAAPLGLIFLPDALKIVVDSRVLYGASQGSYDAVRTAFCFVVIFSLAIGLHAAIRVFRLILLRSKLNPGPKPK